MFSCGEDSGRQERVCCQFQILDQSHRAAELRVEHFFDIMAMPFSYRYNVGKGCCGCVDQRGGMQENTQLSVLR